MPQKEVWYEVWYVGVPSESERGESERGGRERDRERERERERLLVTGPVSVVSEFW
jgi:hypothetical protein